MSQTVIVGNWKMHGILSDVNNYLDSLLPELSSLSKKDVRVLLAVPYTLLFTFSEKAKGSALQIGAQNMSDRDVGPMTGEIAGSMLKDAGASFVILGHSERRQYLQETDEMVHKKLVKALSIGLQPIVCVGESLKEKDAGVAEEVLRKQLIGAFHGLSGEEAARVIVAYEPVWAIGTGMHATPDLANSMHKFCKEVLWELFGKQIADKILLLYGGSVKEDNIAGFTKQEHINGALVGGASLDPVHFLHIIKSS